MRAIDADALIEVIKKSMAENPHKEEMQRAMHIHEHKYFLTLLAGIPTIQPVATDINVGDKISRQQAIELIKNYCKNGCDIAEDNWCPSCQREQFIKLLKALPTVQPEPQEGHWIPHESPDDGEQYECSRCGVLWEFNDGTPEDNEAFYCPNCGARMTRSTK